MLVEDADAVGAGGVRRRRAAGGRLEEEVLAHALQAAVVHEAGELDLADLHRRRRSGLQHRDDAVGADGDRNRVGRKGDGRRQRVAVGGDDLALAVLLEGAVAGVGGGAVGQLDLEEALALDGDVQRVAGLRQVALGEDALGRHRAHAGAELQAGGNLRLRRAGGAGLAQGLVEQVLEHRPRPLEAVGADVGEVVRGDVELGLLGIEAGSGNPERADHDYSFSNRWKPPSTQRTQKRRGHRERHSVSWFLCVLCVSAISVLKAFAFADALFMGVTNVFSGSSAAVRRHGRSARRWTAASAGFRTGAAARSWRPAGRPR